MRVAHVITGLGLGGAEGCLVRLTARDKTNHHTVFSLMDEGANEAVLQRAGIAVQSMGFQRGKFSLSGFFRLVVALRKLQPDLVQTWLYHGDLVGGAAARIAGMNRVFWSIRNTLIAPSQAPLGTRLTVKICAALSGFLPQRVISCSEAAAAEHVRLGYDPSKIAIVPNGFDLDCLQPDEALRAKQRRTWGVLPNEFLLGMVARHDPQKGHETLLRALTLLGSQYRSMLRIAFVGDRLLSSNLPLVNQVKQHGLEDRVLLAGPSKDIPSVMNAFDAHVLSSEYGEGFPNVLAEAMACGLPCVSTDVGDSKMIIGNTGWIAAPGDSSSLALALQNALDEFHTPSWKERKTMARMRILDNFSINSMVENFIAVWEAGGSMTNVTENP